MNERFVIKRESPPHPKPRWWHGRWEIWDTLYEERVIGFATNGYATIYCRWMNAGFRGKPPALTNAEEWAGAS